MAEVAVGRNEVKREVKGEKGSEKKGSEVKSKRR